MTSVLIVEDERELALLLQQFVQAEGISAQILGDGNEVVEWVKRHHPDVILLDLMLPGKDGLVICREIREFTDIPIIMTTAKVDELDRLIGFERGATDYICKPYSSREVIARIKSLVRLYNRGNELDESITLNANRYTVSSKGKEIELSRIEFGVLNLLYAHPKRIYTRAQIIDEVYADNRAVTERNVDGHIKNLRKKLAELDREREYIRAVYGVGYKYEC